MTMVWALSPLIGFFFAPLIGSLSDRCRSKLGRRRPFILLLSLGLLIGLLLIPHGKDLGVLFGDTPIRSVNHALTYHRTLEDFESGINITSELLKYQEPLKLDHRHTGHNENELKIWAVIITIIGVILLDFDADICQTPARAYLVDVSVPEDHSRCLSTFSIMAGVGGSMGYTFGGINWDETVLGKMLGGNIATVFTIVTVIFTLSVILTTTSFREIPLDLQQKDEMLRPVTQNDVIKMLAKKKIKKDIYIMEKEAVTSAKEDMFMQLEHDQIMVQNQLNVQLEHTEEKISLEQYLKSILLMPNSLKILCFTNLLCWMAHSCYALYFTDFVGEDVFFGDPTSPIGSEEHNLFEEGVRFGCFGMAIYAFSCSIYSFCVEYLLKYIRMKYVYVGSLLIFSTGMFFLGTFPSKSGVLVWSVTAGILYATLFTMPFLIVAQYHANGSFKEIQSNENIKKKSTRGVGTDIAIVGSMIFIAQVIVSLGIGWIIEKLDSTCAVIYSAGICSFMAAISATFIHYVEN